MTKTATPHAPSVCVPEVWKQEAAFGISETNGEKATTTEQVGFGADRGVGQSRVRSEATELVERRHRRSGRGIVVYLRRQPRRWHLCFLTCGVAREGCWRRLRVLAISPCELGALLWVPRSSGPQRRPSPMVSSLHRTKTEAMKTQTGSMTTFARTRGSSIGGEWSSPQATVGRVLSASGWMEGRRCAEVRMAATGVMALMCG